MTTVVLGAGGLIGQHMLTQRPQEIFVKKTPFPLYHACDLSIEGNIVELLDRHRPSVVVNLAGENRVDHVDSGVFDDPVYRVNVGLPEWVASWCDTNGAHLIQVSSQGVFSGNNPPYGPQDTPHPITAYGQQKAQAEALVKTHQNWTIVRITFALGVRPFPGLGRENPLEQMLVQDEQRQVNDRWFSPAFASDVAELLWEIVDEPEPRQIIHLGYPVSTCRYELATLVNPAAKVTAVSDDEFPGPRRPVDTAWNEEARWRLDIPSGLAASQMQWIGRTQDLLTKRAQEIALFLGIRYQEAVDRLMKGFHHNHALVAEDFRAANPKTDNELLDWYMKTEAYIWELSAYHLDPGFNYSGMCEGISEKLRAEGKKDVLVLGDGIGDLSMILKHDGLNALYHDLKGSRTAKFAEFRHMLNMGLDGPRFFWTDGWKPEFGDEKWDAVIALDFMEHLTNVEDWVSAVYRGLRPGGKFMAQNAFAIGSGEHGSIPCHLSINDRFEHDWAPLLESFGFRHEVAEWWIKK